MTTPDETQFVDVLMRQGHGATNDELSENLRELTKRVVDTGKSGSVTLTLKLSQLKKTGQLVIEDQIKVRLPEYDRPAGIAFADEDGNLLRDDPNQKTLWDQITDVSPTKGTDTVIEVSGNNEVVDITTGEIKE